MAGYRPQNNGNRSPLRTGSTVSRRLRAAGFNVSPAARKHRHPGLFVSAMGDTISVLVDTDLDDHNERVAAELRDVVATWPEAQGWTTTHISGAVLIHFTYTPTRRRGAAAGLPTTAA